MKQRSETFYSVCNIMYLVHKWLNERAIVTCFNKSADYIWNLGVFFVACQIDHWFKIIHQKAQIDRLFIYLFKIIIIIINSDLLINSDIFFINYAFLSKQQQQLNNNKKKKKKKK